MTDKAISGVGQVLACAVGSRLAVNLGGRIDLSALPTCRLQTVDQNAPHGEASSMNIYNVAEVMLLVVET